MPCSDKILERRTLNIHNGISTSTFLIPFCLKTIDLTFLLRDHGNYEESSKIRERSNEKQWTPHVLCRSFLKTAQEPIRLAYDGYYSMDDLLVKLITITKSNDYNVPQTYE